MSPLTVAADRIYTGEGGPFPGYVTVAGGLIAAVGEGRPDGSAVGGGEILDFGPAMIIPGLIDLHIHGAGGYDASSGSIDELREMALFLAKNGVTAFQPTAGAAPVPELERTIGVVRDLTRGAVCGARSLGLHMEGPFVNPVRKGAMPEECLLAPALALAKRWLDMAGGTIGHVTLAPELPGSLELISYLTSRGVTVSAGHTDATYEQMNEGFTAGITVVDHVFNAMRGFHHREPGAVGAALTAHDVCCELIADGIHVHDAAVRLLLCCKKPDGVCLVSDSISAAGLGPGRYAFLGREVTVDSDGRCFLPDHTLAGGARLLKDCLSRMVEVLGVPFETVLGMATANPAKVARVWDRKGSLVRGKHADLVVLDDGYKVVFSMVEGEIQKQYEGA